MKEVPVAMYVSPLERWRTIACEFRAVNEALLEGVLDPDFGPDDLVKLSRNSPGVKAVYRFLLHIYNSSNPFDLVEIQRWDKDHIQAFSRWAAGTITGWPCHYL